VQWTRSPARPGVGARPFPCFVGGPFATASPGFAQLSPMWVSRAIFAGFLDDPPDRIVRDGIPQGGAALVRLLIVSVVVLAIAAFLGASQLGAGDALWFLLVCAMSGVALGSDLALPSAMLAGLIGRAGERGKSEGAYFGWWNLATKLNLALAAGLALPLLGWLGYAPGARDPHALALLTASYCLLPCALKALAAAALQIFIIQPAAQPRMP